MDLIIWLLNVGTDVKKKSVLNVPGITSSNALIRMKRVKHMGNLTKKVLPPEVDQKRGEGATQTKQEESQMILKKQTLMIQPKERRMMITELMMKNKSEKSCQSLPEKERKKPIG